MLEFRLLGQFDVRANDTALVIPSRLLQSLLGYLLVNRATTHRREQVAGLFWPDTSERNARGSLRQELWRIRKALDACSPPQSDLLFSDDLSVGIDSNFDYWLDVAVLESANTANSSAADLMRSLEAYQGDFLPGFYDEWVTLERERLAALFERQMERLLAQLCGEQRWAEILRWAERWIALGHSPEPAYRALMVAHNALGNRSQVVNVFERCVTALKNDLSVEPSEQTRALYEQLTKDESRKMKDEEIRERVVPVSSFIFHAERSSFDDTPPYKGLHYFDENDTTLFFGRERLVATLTSHLDNHHWLTIVGASGSGKSSLVRAGLVPALKKTSQEWTIQILTPTAHPLEALAIQLTRGTASATATTTLIDDLARDARALRIYVSKSISATHRLLLVIDQFEELFTLCRDEREQQSFIDNLLFATAPELDQPIYVVVALRADFYAQCAAYVNLCEALSRRQELIGPMTAEEMRRAIEEPAARGGWELEPGLVELILRDAGNEPGALPLLSHALLETWNRREEHRLTLAGYASCGGVHGAIAKTAETVFERLSPEEQEIARRIFLQLTEFGEGTPDTRRRVTLAELLPAANDSQVRQVLNRLADARLITVGENVVEVAHEALIREWSRLREWLNQNREGLVLHRRLTEATQAWAKSKRDASELYRGARLTQALEWFKTQIAELNPLEQEFLDASKTAQAREEAERQAQRERELVAAQKLAQAERRRADILRWGVIGSTILLVVMIGLALIAFSQRDTAENERRIAFVRELSVNATDNLAIDSERSVLLALQAVSISSAGGKPVMREAEEALHRAVQASRVQLTLRGHSAGLWSIAYSPDGKRLVTGSYDKTAKVWDAVTGKEQFTLMGHTQSVTTVAFSPDGTRLATGSGDGTAKIWDATTGIQLLDLRGHSENRAIMTVAFSPDGTRLATACLDKTAKVWDVATGKELLTLSGNNGGVSGIAFSPDGKRLVTGSWSDDLDFPAKIWDAASGKLLLTLSGHTKGVYDVAFSPDGKRIATGGGDGNVKLWDSATGQWLTTFFGGIGIYRINFSFDGMRLTTGRTNGTADVWDASTGQLLLTVSGHSGEVWGATFNPDGTRLATSSVDGTAKVWDISPAGNREWLTIASHTGPSRFPVYSADGARLATAGADKTAKVWDPQTGKLLLTLAGHTGEIRSVVFSPDGNFVATTSTDQTAKIWDAATGKPLSSLPSYSILPLGPRTAFSPDGKHIALVTSKFSAVIWDVATGKEVITFCCHTRPIYNTAFNRDGTRLITASQDTTAKVWDTATGKELFTLSEHSGGVNAGVFSPDGKRIATASADGTAKVWDATTGQSVFTLSGHTGAIIDVEFSWDGTRVATAGNDGTVKVWNISSPNAKSEQPLTLYNPNGVQVLGVAFSPDGKRLAASSNDGMLRLYVLPLDDIISIAKSRVTRTLTTDECRKYLHVEACPP